MALISCPECKRPGVSSEAAACPGCGYALQRNKEAQRQRWASQGLCHYCGGHMSSSLGVGDYGTWTTYKCVRCGWIA